MFKYILKLMFSKYNKCNLVFFAMAKMVSTKRKLVPERVKGMSTSSPRFRMEEAESQIAKWLIDSTQIACDCAGDMT